MKRAPPRRALRSAVAVGLALACAAGLALASRASSSAPRPAPGLALAGAGTAAPAGAASSAAPPAVVHARPAAGTTAAAAPGAQPAAPAPAPLPAPPPEGTVNVVSTWRGSPYWASLRVDGLAYGTTPAVLKLPVGEHSIVLERSGFERVERKVTVEAQVPTALRIELRR